MFADHKAIRREAEEFGRLSFARKIERMRDEFAMAALSGVIAAKHYDTVKATCEASYAYADAMMLARTTTASSVGMSEANAPYRVTEGVK